MLLPVEQKIWDLIVEGVKDLELRLVRVRYMTNPKQRATLQIMIEPIEADIDNRVSVTVEECAAVSRMTAAILDVEDPIVEAYNLEVSSTGLQRPLITREDFDLYKTAKVKLELNSPINGQKRFTGVVNGFNQEQDAVDFTELETSNEVQIPFNLFKKAALYYTAEEINKLFDEEKNKTH